MTISELLESIGVEPDFTPVDKFMASPGFGFELASHMNGDDEDGTNED